MTTTIDEPTKTRIVTLTDRAPVKIREDEWPVIASASWSDNPMIPVQASRSAWIKVRQHEDGRTLVYADSASAWAGESGARAGVLLVAGDDIPAAIREVADGVGYGDELAQDCIADLPAVEL